MSRIDRAFERESKNRQAALILYVTAGHPDKSMALQAARACAEVADMVEIGVPFSDPVADGPTVQESTQVALRNGTRLADCFELARTVRSEADTPLVFLTYYNPVLRHGLEEFARDSREAGVDGIICADLPADEAGPLHQKLAAEGINYIPMVAPTSTDRRLKAACDLGSGFVYCVSRTGVTGAQESLSAAVGPLLERVRASSVLPRAVGFGVSTAEQARQVAQVAEGVIIGSALVRMIGASTPDTVRDRIVEFAAGIRGGMNGSS